MKNKPKACSFPIESLIVNESKTASFQDSYTITTNNSELDVLQIYLLMINKAPKWINFLLSCRNNLVKLVGLKNVGNLVGKNPVDSIGGNKLVGAKLDFFTIHTLNSNEMVLILNDKHLDIKLSILKSEGIIKKQIFVSTIVNFNNFLGNVYMFLIAPFHKLVVKRLMSNIP